MAAGAAPRGPQQDHQAEPERHVSVVRWTEPGPAHPTRRWRPCSPETHSASTPRASTGRSLRPKAPPSAGSPEKGAGEQVPTDLGGIQADARVLAITKWSSDKSDPEYRRGLAKGNWEVVIPEIRITPT